jgi:hypothetical protein
MTIKESGNDTKLNKKKSLFDLPNFILNWLKFIKNKLSKTAK